MASTKGNLLIVLAFFLLTSIASAFGPQWGGGPRSGGAKRMIQELNLSAEQQEQVQTMMQKHREEGKKWREQHRKDMETKLSGVLTVEQLEKFKSIKQQGSFRKGMGQGKGGRGQGRCGMRTQ